MENSGFGVPDGFKSHEEFLHHQNREQQRLNKEQADMDLAESKSNDFGILVFVVIIAVVIIAGLIGASV
jgi:hypothetical protein